MNFKDVNAAPASPRGRFLLGSAGVLATIATVKASAKAAQYMFKCASDFPTDNPANARQRQMWAAIEQETGGRVHTDYFPNSQLGSAPAMFEQLRVGALQFQMAGPGYLASVVPAANISYLGFAFKDADEGLKVMDGPLGGYVRDEAAKKGIHVMRTIWDSGMFVTTSTTHPIKVPDDLKGFKLRITESSIFVDLFKTFSAIPSAVNTAEIYSALQTKLIDGTTSALVNVEAAKWYEVSKYISLTNHAWNGPWIIANGDIWKSLPTDIQDTIERNCTKYGLLERRDIKQAGAQAADRMTKQGIVVNAVDPAPFRARLHSYYEFWGNSFGSTAVSLLQNSLGHKVI